MASTQKQTKRKPNKTTSTAPVVRIKKTLKVSITNYLARRPHRSFRRTRRRDYTRSLKLPGYFGFTRIVRKTLLQHREIFIFLIIIYALLTALMVGIASQDAYTSLTDIINQSSGGLFAGGLGELGKSGLLLLSAAVGGISSNLTSVQQVYAGLLVLLVWLTTVWLLRNILAGHKVKLRDGLYNASAPLLSTFIVALVLLIQLIPVAIAALGYSAAQSTGLISAGGVEAMLFWIAAGLLVLLSLYWITSTFIALVVVTLPGMYPMEAIKTAGDLVIGRRMRILLRMLWLGLTIIVMWVVVMIPVILFDTWLKGIVPTIQWLPVVPIAFLILSSITVIWAASYIYLLYRRIVADDAVPA
jgi:hypothetical protein